MEQNQQYIHNFHKNLAKKLSANEKLTSPKISGQGQSYESGIAAVGVVRCLVNRKPITSFELSKEREY
jgi:hypothetical protein